MKEWVLWACRKGAEEWQAELITSTSDKEHLAKARVWAEANGFDRFRVSSFDGEKPDFVKAMGLTPKGA